MNETINNDIKNIANDVATEAKKILNSEKVNRFFRIGFFVVLALLIASIGLTVYTRLVPSPDNPLRSVVAEQQARIDSLSGTIDDLTELNKQQLKSMGELEAVDIRREAGLGRIDRILGDVGNSIGSAKSGNERAALAFDAIERISFELEAISNGNSTRP
jgi:hypothetical protein